MWRHLKRGLHQNFKRSICLDKPDSCIKDGKPIPLHGHGCALVRAIQNLNGLIIKENKGQDKKDYYDKTSSNISQHSLFEAFGWSGAVVFGWVISKQLWFSHLWSRDEETPGKNDLIKYHNFLEILSHIVKTQPPARNILPQLRTPKSDTSSKDVEDEFEEAAQELQKIHNKAIGEALNRRGIACLSKSTSAEAIQYFKRASELKYAPASFNMGQCCELGIGTKQDFQEAAIWYKQASEEGHATAMYNLGVFYAHGWGGLQANTKTAKELFVKAAILGQPDAKAALEKESKASANMSFETLNNQPTVLSDSLINTLHNRKSPSLDIFVNKIRNGLTEDAFLKELGSDKKWDIPLSSAVAF